MKLTPLVLNPGDALGQAAIDRFDGTGNGIANDSAWRVAA